MDMNEYYIWHYLRILKYHDVTERQEIVIIDIMINYWTNLFDAKRNRTGSSFMLITPFVVC